MIVSHINFWTVMAQHCCMLTVASSAALHCHDYPIIESLTVNACGGPWGLHACAWH